MLYAHRTLLGAHHPQADRSAVKRLFFFCQSHWRSHEEKKSERPLGLIAAHSRVSRATTLAASARTL